jgi:hypothetical protein
VNSDRSPAGVQEVLSGINSYLSWEVHH